MRPRITKLPCFTSEQPDCSDVEAFGVLLSQPTSTHPRGDTECRLSNGQHDCARGTAMPSSIHCVSVRGQMRTISKLQLSVKGRLRGSARSQVDCALMRRRSFVHQAGVPMTTQEYAASAHRPTASGRRPAAFKMAGSNIGE